MKLWPTEHLVVVACALGLGLAGCSGGKPADSAPPRNPGLIEVATPDGILRVPELGFEVAMPGVVTRRKLEAAVPTWQFDSSIGGANKNDQFITMSVTVSEHPPGALAAEPPGSLFSRMMSGAAERLQGDVESVTDIEVAGVPGKEFAVATWSSLEPRFLVRRVFIIGDRLYSMTALTLARFHRARTRRDFLDSFKGITR